MSEFIVGYEMEKIKNANTRKYLSEVISSYNDGNYRAAIVLLYSVVLVDILHKLIQLKEIYDSKEAEEILKDIKDMQEKDEFSAMWERELISRVTANIKNVNTHDTQKKYIALLDSFSYGKFDRLKKDRNKCAHPTHDENYLLRDFNRDETRAHIRNMMEHILLKDTILGSNTCELLKEEIQNIKNIFNYNDIFNPNDKLKIKKYLSDKFFNKYDEISKKQVFRFLWETTLGAKNNENRGLKYFVLSSFINEHFEFLIKYFKEDSFFEKDIYIDDVPICEEYKGIPSLAPSPKNIDCNFALITCFFAEHKKFYDLLSEYSKEKVKAILVKHFNYYLLAYFLHEDMNTHLNKVSEIVQKAGGRIGDFDEGVLLQLYEYSREMGSRDEELVRKFILESALDQRHYETCECALKFVVFSLLPDLTKEDFEKIFDVMDRIDDFYDMWGNYRDIPPKSRSIGYYLGVIKTYSDKVLGADYDYRKYINLRRHLQ